MGVGGHVCRVCVCVGGMGVGGMCVGGHGCRGACV